MRLNGPDGTCWSCTGRAARYLWISRRSGNSILLCVQCCAWWRQNAVREPDLAPSRITDLENINLN